MFTSFLTGCAAIKKLEQQEHINLLNYAKSMCLEYGFKESTDSFASCIQTEVNEVKNRSAMNSAILEANRIKMRRLRKTKIK